VSNSQRCGSDADCKGTRICVNGSCADMAGVTDATGPSGGAGGTNQGSSSPSATGTGGGTLPGACGGKHSLGGTCDSNADCAETCVESVCVAFPVAAGKPCDDDDDCGGGQTTFCLQGMCQNRQYDGKYPLEPPFCDSDCDCVDCRGCYKSKCVGWQPLGGGCDSDLDCYSLNDEVCISGKCAPAQTTFGAFCDSDRDCSVLGTCFDNKCLESGGGNCDSDRDCGSIDGCHPMPNRKTGGETGDRGITGD
jgi:hypothetical protein